MSVNGLSTLPPNSRKLPKLAPGDEIVISGISGRFPESDNIRHLQENLMSKKNLVTGDDRRFTVDNPDIPRHTGKVNNLEKFDALFFGVHVKQAHSMDPMARILLEHTYEAIVDAGINPKEIRNSRTGVFIGACISESEKCWSNESKQFEGYIIAGSNRAMYANRISYVFSFTGPSHAVDTACSSSCTAFELAYRSILEGVCDAAIVGGANLCLDPVIIYHFWKLGVLCNDGSCKTFDEKANGYVRSETISTLLLQRAKDAKRIYATVVHAKSNCDGFKEEGITFPSTRMQKLLLKEVYAECGINPSKVNYIEAHGTGTEIGDPEEINAIDSVLTVGRTEPLLIGSVKSNLGHSEGGSGMCSLAKVVIAMESGVIPPNINYYNPRKSLKAIIEGRLKVVAEPTPWEGGYAALSSFGFGGANVHVLLKSNPKKKINNGAPNDNLPRLVVASGRTEDAVATILKDIESRPVDVEYVKLLHDLHSQEIRGHLYRGYTVLPSHDIVETPVRSVQSFTDVEKPVVFLFSGMGSQWPGMGEALLRLPIFMESIKKCDAALKPHGIDIFSIITTKDKSIFDNILHSFVGIAAIQIGLVDVLTSVGIKPDFIIGHSVGELGCAYADGCFTAEQMILSAYSRGKASIETKFIFGSMAAVGLGYQKLKDMCPPDIEIACHNSGESATISGPAESMKAFVEELKAKDIFAREVPCSNIAYHSRYIASAGPKLLAYLKKVIPHPKPRSKKWLSTSVPINKWNSPEARFSSAEYHTNNLLGSVLFEETAKLLPKKAVAIEIAPHGLLQAIVRRSFSRDVANIALTKRGSDDNLQVLLEGIGKMFTAGLHPQIVNLYPSVKYPVSCGTPMISPLIKWEHSEDWFVPSFKMLPKDLPTEKNVYISLSDDKYKHIAGHVIDGRPLFPATGYLLLVWNLFASTEGTKLNEQPVVFENVKFLRATTVPNNVKIMFRVSIQKGTGKFEVSESEAAVVSGSIRICSDVKAEMLGFKPNLNDDEEESMTTRDIYKELRLRGYQYTGLFKNLKSATITGSKGHITWNNEWISFMDNMLQIMILTQDSRGLFVPTAVKKIVIDPKYHTSLINDSEEKFDFPVYTNKKFNLIISGGVEMRGLQVNAISRRKPTGEPVLEEYKFVPFIDNNKYSNNDIVRYATHICLENLRTIKIKAVEFIEEADQIQPQDLLSPSIAECCSDLPLIQPDINVYCKSDYFEEDALPSNITIVDPKSTKKDEPTIVLAIGHRLLNSERKNNLEFLLSKLRPGGFLLSREEMKDLKSIKEITDNEGLHIISTRKSENEMFILLRKQEEMPKKITVIKVNNTEFDWVEKMRSSLKEEMDKETEEPSRIIFVGQGDFDNGLLGLVNCLRQEPGGEIVRGILIQDRKAPEFSLENPFYIQQIQKDLTHSVLRENGVWGSYRHSLLQPPKLKSVKQAIVTQLTRGDLSSLTWVEGPNIDDKNAVNVVYAGLNFKDVMVASGKIPVETFIKDRKEIDYALGFEWAGVDMSGKRKMGMLINRGLTNCISLDNFNITFDVPDNWTLEEAVTTPVVYSTCYFALYEKGNLKRGEKVLIHAGSGGIGQAAIHICLHEGCEIFTTVGTPEKREFLHKHFPQIRDDHIGNSRDTSFELMVMEQTNGQGVDIVLNSLAEDKLQASVRCLAQEGRFLEIGKYDMVNDNALGMQCFMREISFQGVLLDALFDKREERRLKLKQMVEDGFKKGAIKPLVRTVFPKDEVEPMFRYMAAGKHIGKVVLKVRDEKENLNAPILAIPRFTGLQGRTYIVLGGLGGFGLELVDWLILRDAKNIVITSRSGIKNGYQKSRIELWKSYGVNINIISGKDVSQEQDCQSILEAANKLGPVDGIFNLAVVLKDALWENHTPETFKESFCPKAWATKHLDALSRKLCPRLRYFVVFSSVSCGRGNAGQTNYGMSNSVMERICERRVSDGLPGLAIQWGAVGDVGLVAEMQENHKEIVIGGTLQQRITSCLQTLDHLLCQDKPIVSSMVVAEKKMNSTEGLTVTEAVLNIMSLKDLKGINVNTSLAEIGMDSMMGVEIKQTLEREFDIYLTAQDIRTLNFAKLQELSEKQSTKKVSKNSAIGLDSEGINVLLRVIGNEDLNSEICLKLLSNEEPGKEEVFLIPGIESVASIFTTLAQNIRSSAICLQLGIQNHDHTSIFDMANQLYPYVYERRKDQLKFTIVGYSFGAVIAIELVRKLEAAGFTGRLILIDGAPEQLQTISTQLTGTVNSVSELQDSILIALCSKYSENSEFVIEMMKELKKCKKWEDKMEACSKYAPHNMQYMLSPENQKALATAIYKRTEALQAYDITQLKPIETPITLIRPTERSTKLESEDYGLSKVTKGEVEVVYGKGNHLTVLDDKEIAKVINSQYNKFTKIA